METYFIGGASLVTTKQWKLVVTPLSGTTPLHQFEFEGGNWMAALRDARQELGEEGGLPSGASCTVAPDGTVTILDPEARRKFLLTPVARTTVTQAAAAETASKQASGATAATAATGAKPKFQTVAYAPGQALPPPNSQGSAGQAQPVRPVSAQQRPMAQQPSKHSPVLRPAAPQSPRPWPAAMVSPPPRAASKRVDTADYEDDPKPRVMGTSSTANARVNVATRATPGLELLLTRDADPTPDNPLVYRERAYLVPHGMTAAEAEAALRLSLAQLQQTLEALPRGKLVNLAAFDHSWTDRPQRPPLVAIEWRDWRGEALVDYPAADQAAEPRLASGEGDERLAAVFESLHELLHMSTPAEGLEFSVQMLGHAVGSEALSACLYDINTDELRFVAALGKGAASVQGRANALGGGVLRQAAQLEHAALVINDVNAEPSYDPNSDGRPGLAATNMLLRSLTHEGRLLGMLQLINRSTGSFSAADVHLVNYVADRLTEFLREARARVGP